MFAASSKKPRTGYQHPKPGARKHAMVCCHVRNLFCAEKTCCRSRASASTCDTDEDERHSISRFGRFTREMGRNIWSETYLKGSQNGYSNSRKSVLLWWHLTRRMLEFHRPLFGIFCMLESMRLKNSVLSLTGLRLCLSLLPDMKKSRKSSSQEHRCSNPS